VESITSRLSDDAPAKASVQSMHELSVELENRVLTWRSVLDFSSDEKTFFYRYKRTLEENGQNLVGPTNRLMIGANLRNHASLCADSSFKNEAFRRVASTWNVVIF
jgi:hypothetical protein